MDGLDNSDMPEVRDEKAELELAEKMAALEYRKAVNVGLVLVNLGCARADRVFPEGVPTTDPPDSVLATLQARERARWHPFLPRLLGWLPFVGRWGGQRAPVQHRPDKDDPPFPHKVEIGPVPPRPSVQPRVLEELDKMHNHTDKTVRALYSQTKVREKFFFKSQLTACGRERTALEKCYEKELTAAFERSGGSKKEPHEIRAVEALHCAELADEFAACARAARFTFSHPT
eukprot:Hpha_TRINITY_DN6442_c0_g1::TRINITY_DN6442_c0_g1_i1::g.86::m.86